MKIECCKPYRGPLGKKGVDGESGSKGPKGDDGSGGIKKSKHKVLRADFEPTASEHIVWDDSRRVISEEVKGSRKFDGSFTAYPYREFYWNQPEFEEKNITIPANTLSKDGDQLSIKLSFHKNDSLGSWRLPILFFNNKEITCRTWFNGVGGLAAGIYEEDSMKFYPRIFRNSKRGYIAFYTIKISRINNFKIGTVCTIKVFEDPKTVSGKVNPKKLSFNQEPSEYFYSNIITSDLNLKSANYNITYRIAASGSTTLGVGEYEGKIVTTDILPAYIKDLLVEKISVL